MIGPPPPLPPPPPPPPLPRASWGVEAGIALPSAWLRPLAQWSIQFNSSMLLMHRVMLFSDLQHLADFATSQFGPTDFTDQQRSGAAKKLLRHLKAGLGGDCQRYVVIAHCFHNLHLKVLFAVSCLQSSL